jgi:hypothetical protein
MSATRYRNMNEWMVTRFLTSAMLRTGDLCQTMSTGLTGVTDPRERKSVALYLMPFLRMSWLIAITSGCMPITVPSWGATAA